MKVEELVSCKVTLNKKRNENFWDLSRRPELKEAITACLATGEQQIVDKRGSMMVFIVRPEYPLIESAMREPENKSFVRVSIIVLTHALHMGVRCEACGGQGLVALVEENAMTRCPECRPEDFAVDVEELGFGN